VVTDAEPAELVELDVLAVQPSGALVGRDARGRIFAAGPTDPCGQCEICRRGGAAVCPAMRPREDGPRVRVSARWAVELADGLVLPLPEAAAVGGDIATAYTLYARTGLGPRDPVAITGTTAVTRFLVEILRAKGLVPIVVSDEPSWCSFVTSRGAVAATHDRVGDALVAQGMGARPLRVIATGDFATAFALAGPRATLTLLGCDGAIPGELAAREVTIIGVAGPHPDLITEAAALCARGQVDLHGGVGDGPTQARVTSRA
jgi:D-arabinose 1-dehydrogenase-like Zn-dependent alcohol dehydrogenase